MRDGFRYEGTLAVVGGGRMGEAIVRGLLGSGAVDAARVTICEPTSRRREELTAAYGVRCVAHGADGLPADIVILAVKPQVIDAVVAELSEALSKSLVVSIAAGVTCASLESVLQPGAAVVRVMPNTPAMVGEAMSVVSGGGSATAAQVDLVRALFALVGEAIVLDERYQDIATAISGSGPAYFALVVDALARAGVRWGLQRETAQALAVQTMLGTAKWISESGTHPAALIDAVSSPGGTTAAAVDALEAYGVRSAFADAVAAAVERAKELGA
ncbi:MAG: pyrroline-5-carboxylate reductase [Coriobacteriia bacterium]|nr:pyrroline-5-carboxylate reductase [Coriobacteriia bacterium]